MENNLNFLDKTRVKYCELLIEIGLQWMELNPYSSPIEFVDYYFPPRELVLEILLNESANIKNRFDVIHKSKVEKMSLYPSLEDMKVDQTIRAQLKAYDAISQQQNFNTSGVPSAPPLNSHSPVNSPVYPDLIDYMGLELSQDVIAVNMPEYLRNGNQQLTTYTAPSMPNNMIAPLSGNSLGLIRAGTTTNGVRELILCKDQDGKVGLRAQSINKGIFVCMVVKNSPAALAGLRFGDQLLQINGATVAGYSVDDVHKLLKKSSVNNISVVIRDRPFERTVTLHKDSSGCIGFQFKNGKITSIVKDSSAARNGLLIDHQLLEVDGQNVIGIKDKEITKIIQSAERVVTITIMPTFLYEHMIKKLSTSFIKDKMDHSVPDF